MGGNAKADAERAELEAIISELQNELRLAKEQQRRNEQLRMLAEELVDGAPVPVVVLLDDRTVVTANSTFYTHFRIGEIAAQRKHLLEIGRGRFDFDAMREVLNRLEDEPSTETQHSFTAIGARSLHLRVRRLAFGIGEPTYYALYIEDRTLMQASVRELADRARQTDLRLREIQHRMKNHLATLASLMSLKANASPSADARAGFREAHNRLMAMSSIHDTLSKNDGSSSILEEHARYLFELIRAGDEAPMKLRIHSTDTSVGAKQLIPLSLVLTEIFTNAAKHAVRPGRTLTVSFAGRIDEYNFLEIEVADDGPGLGAEDEMDAITEDVASESGIAAGPELPEPESGGGRTGGSGGIGLTILQNVVEAQLGGTWEMEGSAGVRHVLRVPLTP